MFTITITPANSFLHVFLIFQCVRKTQMSDEKWENQTQKNRVSKINTQVWDWYVGISESST